MTNEQEHMLEFLNGFPKAQEWNNKINELKKKVKEFEGNFELQCKYLKLLNKAIENKYIYMRNSIKKL
jgi:hypothetical protein